MRNLLASLSLLAVLASPSVATPWGNFRSVVTPSNLKPFALDLGGLLGGAAFHSGRSLGFPGFDVGIVAMSQFQHDSANTILRSSVDNTVLPLVQAEVGLPFKMDVIAHGVSGAGANVIGGGLRYGVLRSGMLVKIPDVAVTVIADKVNHEHFSAEHYSANAAASWHLPIIHPYIGVGYDLTRVKVGAASTPGVVGASAWARGTRLTAGLDISPLPILHIFAAYSLRHGLPGADFGIGARW